MPLSRLRIVIILGADVSRTSSVQPRQVHPMPSVTTLVFSFSALSCFAYVCASPVTSEAMVTLAWPPTPANPCLVVCPQGGRWLPLAVSHSLSASPACIAHQRPKLNEFPQLEASPLPPLQTASSGPLPQAAWV